jgi:hypothetical protein
LATLEDGAGKSLEVKETATRSIRKEFNVAYVSCQTILSVPYAAIEWLMQLLELSTALLRTRLAISNS